MSRSYFNDNDADTIHPSNEQVLQNKIRELTGLDPQALEDEQGKPLPGITPESVESNHQEIINAIGDLKRLTEKRADSEKQAKLAEDIAAAIDPNKPAETVLHVIQRIEDTLTEPLQPTPKPTWKEVDEWKETWLIRDWLPTGCLTIFVGRAGYGKTFIMLQIACALIEGIPDYALTPYYGTADELREYQKVYDSVLSGTHRVAIASYEENILRTYDRISQIAKFLGHIDRDKVRDNLELYEMKTLGPLWGVEKEKHFSTRGELLKEGRRLFDSLLRLKPKPSLLVIDPSAAAFAGNENDRAQVRDFANELNAFSEAENLATLLIAHPSRAGMQAGADAHWAGSTDWEGACRSMWALVKEEIAPSKQEQKEAKDEGISVNAKEFYTLQNTKRNYTRGENLHYLRKVEDETSSRYDYSPIWVSCTQEEAIEFGEDYKKNHPVSLPTTPNLSNAQTQEDTHDGTEIEEAYIPDF